MEELNATEDKTSSNDMDTSRKKQNEYLKKYRARNKEKCAEFKRRYYAKNKQKVSEVHREYYIKNKEKFREKHREYRDKNKEKIREQSRKYAAENPQQLAKSHREYYIKNKEKILERQQKYRDENKGRVNEYIREYYARNREKMRERSRLRYARNKERIKERTKDDISKKKRKYHEKNKEKERAYSKECYQKKCNPPCNARKEDSGKVHCEEEEMQNIKTKDCIVRVERLKLPVSNELDVIDDDISKENLSEVSIESHRNSSSSNVKRITSCVENPRRDRRSCILVKSCDQGIYAEQELPVVSDRACLREMFLQVEKMLDCELV